ncbi:uncharacterized protein STEHIDRAFT_96587 [Stereum hirsutum FP-91666 SS1]|uniref:uncharacterized protein n=1 Tax=Stereum hirsutum (strain FP-91666) TaxID=721885 RepID=UPI000440BF62|nr:uncharacterized protein STEHIDRAFT_96587 [Stereum hirsutum FP-91666 SS1]EIM87474.1 hypothetical protein STEHIDRAFT_96587 [Stereum hirsutum FP-91666 SS1]
MAQPNPHPPNRMQVAGTVSFYLVAALAMVMANKWVLDVTTAPLFFLFTQLLIAVVLFLGANAVGIIKIPIHVDMIVIKGLAPMIALNVVGLSANNYTLKFVDASFYQVARGLVLPLTVLTSYLFLSSPPPSPRILLSCTLVTCGFFIGVFLDHTPVSPLGLFFGIISSAMTASHAVVIKKSLEVVGGSALNLSYYSNLLSALVLLPLIVVAGEGPEVMKLLVGEGDGFKTIFWGSTITGGLGFLMSIASTLSIKITSPITHMISSAIRGVAASLLGMWLFKDVLSSGRVWAIAVILFGSLHYTWVKHIESQQPSAKAASKASYDRIPLSDLEEAEEGKRGIEETNGNGRAH